MAMCGGVGNLQPVTPEIQVIVDKVIILVPQFFIIVFFIPIVVLLHL